MSFILLPLGTLHINHYASINHYVTKDRINNMSFSQKLDPISKNITRRQNPLELVFEDISTFDAENPIVGSLLKELDVGKKDIATELIKKTARPPGLNFATRKRFTKLKNRPEPKDDDDYFNLLPPSSPPGPPSLGPQHPQPLGPPAAPPVFPPPSERFLEPSQQPTAQPRPLPPLNLKGSIGAPSAPSAPPLSPSDYFLLEPSAWLVSTAPRPLTPTAPPLSRLEFILSNNLYGCQTQTLTREKEEIKNTAQKELDDRIYELPDDPPMY